MNTSRNASTKPSQVSQELMMEMLQNPEQVNFKVDQLIGTIGRPKKGRININ